MAMTGRPVDGQPGEAECLCPGSPHQGRSTPPWVLFCHPMVRNVPKDGARDRGRGGSSCAQTLRLSTIGNAGPDSLSSGCIARGG